MHKQLSSHLLKPALCLLLPALLAGPVAYGQLRELASLSEAEINAAILRSVYFRLTSARPAVAALLPDLSAAGLQLISREIGEAINTRQAMPRFETEALCNAWHNSQRSGDNRVLEALAAYDQTLLRSSENYARPFVEALADIEAGLTGSDRQNFNNFMNDFRQRYRSGSAQTGSFFSSVLHDNLSLGAQSIPAQCDP